MITMMTYTLGQPRIILVKTSVAVINGTEQKVGQGGQCTRTNLHDAPIQAEMLELENLTRCDRGRRKSNSITKTDRDSTESDEINIGYQQTTDLRKTDKDHRYRHPPSSSELVTRETEIPC
eukprot:Lithocolla_globosa_v1_NODE_2226_length_2101_cov_10.636852.p2 type:complete len:121 gc:universal NODE_2226_length_2101_cov_10.636852:213-575(+)